MKLKLMGGISLVVFLSWSALAQGLDDPSDLDTLTPTPTRTDEHQKTLQETGRMLIQMATPTPDELEPEPEPGATPASASPDAASCSCNCSSASAYEFVIQSVFANEPVPKSRLASLTCEQLADAYEAIGVRHGYFVKDAARRTELMQRYDGLYVPLEHVNDESLELYLTSSDLLSRMFLRKEMARCSPKAP